MYATFLQYHSNADEQPSYILLPTAEDILVYKDESEPEWFWGADVTEDDGRYLMMSISKDTSRVC